jgi:hypothetical protein
VVPSEGWSTVPPSTLGKGESSINHEEMSIARSKYILRCQFY